MPLLSCRLLLIASALVAQAESVREPVRYRLDILRISSSVGSEGTRSDTLFTTITLAVTLSDSGNARLADIVVDGVSYRRMVDAPVEVDSSAIGVTARMLVVPGRSARMLGTFGAPPGRKATSLQDLTFALRELFPVVPITWRPGQSGVPLPVNSGAYILTSWRAAGERQGMIDITSSDSLSFKATQMDDDWTGEGTDRTSRDVTTSRDGPIDHGTVRRIFRSEGHSANGKQLRSATQVVTTVIARIP